MKSVRKTLNNLPAIKLNSVLSFSQAERTCAINSLPFSPSKNRIMIVK